MALLLTIPSASYLAGTRSFETPSDIAAGLSQVRLQMTLESWPVVAPNGGNPDGAVLAAGILWSPDSGANFFPLLSWRAPGFVTPPINPRTGLPITSTDTFIGLPQVGNSNRRLRCTVQNFATVLTAISIQAS